MGLTHSEFKAWAEGRGWQVIAYLPAVITARKIHRTLTWEKHDGVWRITEKRGRRGGAEMEET